MPDAFDHRAVEPPEPEGDDAALAAGLLGLFLGGAAGFAAAVLNASLLPRMQGMSDYYRLGYLLVAMIPLIPLGSLAGWFAGVAVYRAWARRRRGCVRNEGGPT
jgi:hypothetical protein